MPVCDQTYDNDDIYCTAVPDYECDDFCWYRDERDTQTKDQDSAMPDQNKYLLLKNGTALIHGEDDDVKAVRTDILVCGSTVSMVAPNIAPPPGSEVMWVQRLHNITPDTRC
jgi:hypothetical protein